MAVHTTAILIISNLLLGNLSAIAHHVFYESLDGQLVADQNQQEWYLRIGTGLSFAVRTLLFASIGSAYVQLIWSNIKYATISINGLDALFGVSSNIWDLAVWELWRTRPMLTVVAVGIWILPLTAVVTPATLTIEAARNPRAYEITLPLLVPAYTEPWKYADMDGYNYEFHQGSSRLLRLFNSVTSLGTILAIHPPFPNSSYTLDFYGPSIACQGLPPGSHLKQLIGNLFQDEDGYTSMPYYAGFIPNSYCGNVNGCPSNMEDDEIAISALRQTLNSTLVNNLITYDNVSEEYAKMYVFVHNSASDPPFTTIECQFYNSSYLVKANFIDGQQEISYTTKKLNGVSSRSANSCYKAYSEFCGIGISYLSFIDALGKIVLGTLSDGDSDSITPAIIPTRTQILTTVLSQSWEFRNMPEMQQGPSTIAIMSLAEALEQIVTNTTLSLLSDSYFLQDVRKTSGTDVTVRSPQNAYSYKSRNLLIAYCLGCAVTAFVAAFGLQCIFSTSASYSTRFSTILRTTGGLHADAGITPADTSGAEPLPPGLAEKCQALRE